ncbi:MAG: 4-hydroxythreonine-4-phosphate dehydrogenase PdxA [Chloroflexi bacterium]|nr:4-hydroxythreonine-4-phosphate dehydrogenase PdxA [Chloroflexota bacterium]
MPDTSLPTVAITLGDPAGIGPEVVVKALVSLRVQRTCRPLVVGTWELVQEAARAFAPKLHLRRVAKGDQPFPPPASEHVLVLDAPGPTHVQPGRATAEGGAASVAYVEIAGRLALQGAVDAIATAPINKEAVHLAGYQEIGHLEILSRLAGVTDTATMLVGGGLRVVHLTTHVPLAQAASYVTRERVLARLRLTHRSLEEWGIRHPRIGVAALNPHGGDGGILGREEIEEIGPAVNTARQEGIEATGPFPSDSIFLRAVAGEFDAVLALYHDQGHIPIKVRDFDRSVAVTLGLPFVRTSVDHGTAYDIAGRGVANPAGMEEAILLAAALGSGAGLAPSRQAVSQV